MDEAADRPRAREGLLLIDKPQGPTSHAVPARVRTWSGRMRCGHAGTLDPMATGLLIVGLGRATRVLGYLSGCPKTYQATLRLGVSTDTDDAMGSVLAAVSTAHLATDDVDAAIAGLRGPILQRPSAVSAIKVGGRRAYSRARSGEQVELPTRPVEVYDFLRLAPIRRLAEGGTDVDVRVRCSSGTYVRALARDLGQALGVGGHVTALRRTAVASLDVAEAVPFAELDPVTGVPVAQWPVREPGQILARVLPSIVLEAADAQWVRNGRRLPVPAHWPGPGPVVLLNPDGTFCAVARAQDDQVKYQVVLQ